MNLKRKHIIIIVFLVTILLLTTLGVKELISRETVDQTAYTLQAQKLFKDAYSQVERIRNVTLPQVDLEVVTRDWAIQTWGVGYAQPDLQNIQRTERVYKGLFLIPENSSLYQAQVDWAGNIGAASWNGKIYVVRENFDPFNYPDAEATFVHELTHVMQNQFSIPSVTPTFDSERARTALIEGDASFMGDFFMNQTRAFSVSAIANTASSFMILMENPLLNGLHPSIPSSVSDFDYFPYNYGKDFIEALYEKGGWVTVNQAYANPPNTTEQILHPEKYFAAEPAQNVSAPSFAEKDWTAMKTDQFGEYFIQVMLGNWLSQNQSKTAAAGWGGDNMTYYERGNDYLFTWRIGWDSAGDASEFSIAFHDMMDAAGATRESNSQWFANGRYLSIDWNQSSNSTLIACSTDETAVQPSSFALP